MNRSVFRIVVCLLAGGMWCGAQEAQNPPPATRQQTPEQEAQAAFVRAVQLYTGIGGEARDVAAAAASFLRAAERGHAPAQYAYGVCCREGLGVEKNAEETVRWLRAAAEQGYAPAQTTLGVCYEKGEGVQKDPREAVRWYRAAADQGFPRAQSNLAYCYGSGQGLEMDRETACMLYIKAAKAGFAPAQNGIGWAYMNHLGVERNYEKAIEWLLPAARQGHDRALTNLGVCYAHTYSRKDRGAEIYRAYRQAAEQGFSNAQNLLAECYASGTGVKENQALAALWHRAAAEQGNRFSQYALGNRYEYAKGVRYDAEEAVHLYHMAALQQNPNGMVQYARCCMEGFGGAQEDGETIFHLISEGLKLGEYFPYAETLLGECYEQGIGVPADPKLARDIYSSAARKEHTPRIINNYSRCLYLGIGGPKDLPRLLDMWKANSGDKSSLNELGVCYELGEGVEKDLEQAVTHYRRAAEKGDPVARFNLARCYDLGIGVAKNRTRAAEWYFKSANKAFKPAIEAYKHMGLQLTPLYKHGRYHSMAALGSRIPKPDAPEPNVTEPLRTFLCGRDFFAWEELPYNPSMEIKTLDDDPTPADEVPPAKTTAQVNSELVDEGDAHWAAGRRDEAIQLYLRAAEKWSNEARIRLALCALYGLGMPRDKTAAQKYTTAAVNIQGGMSEVVDEVVKTTAE